MKPPVVHHKFPLNQYYPETTPKSQIVLHHTVSGQSVSGDINWWKQTPSRIATCVIIHRDGTIHTLFRSEKWAHHLGIKKWIFQKLGLKSYGANLKLNKSSIGVELDSWGGVTKRNGKYYRTGNKEIPAHEVVDYGREIRGFRYYEKYTNAQIESLKYLLKYWNDKYGIPIRYNEDMWGLSRDALSGKPGVYTHVSYRPDKSDCHPQKELISMLKSL